MSMKRFMVLAGKAGQERGPRVDVADRVVATLTEGQRRAVYAEERPLVWIAAAGAAVAAPVAVAAVAAYQAMVDPLIWITQTISWVAQ